MTLIVVGVLAVAGLVYAAMGIVKKTDVYADAIASAQQSAEVQAALGTPVETGWVMQGSVKYTNGDGTADLSVPLSGPNGKGTLVVKAAKSAGGSWEYSVLEVRVSGRDAIDLRRGR